MPSLTKVPGSARRHPRLELRHTRIYESPSRRQPCHRGSPTGGLGMAKFGVEARVTIGELSRRGVSRCAIARTLGVTESAVRYHLFRQAAGAVDGRTRQTHRAATRPDPAKAMTWLTFLPRICSGEFHHRSVRLTFFPILGGRSGRCRCLSERPGPRGNQSPHSSRTVMECQGAAARPAGWAFMWARS